MTGPITNAPARKICGASSQGRVSHDGRRRETRELQLPRQLTRKQRQVERVHLESKVGETKPRLWSAGRAEVQMQTPIPEHVDARRDCAHNRLYADTRWCRRRLVVTD